MKKILKSLRFSVVILLTVFVGSSTYMHILDHQATLVSNPTFQFVGLSTSTLTNEDLGRGPFVDSSSFLERRSKLLARMKFTNKSDKPIGLLGFRRDDGFEFLSPDINLEYRKTSLFFPTKWTGRPKFLITGTVLPFENEVLVFIAPNESITLLLPIHSLVSKFCNIRGLEFRMLLGFLPYDWTRVSAAFALPDIFKSDVACVN